MINVPHDLDWVARRAACNVGQVFDELCVGIRKDIDAINQARGLKEPAHFAANLLSDNSTIVVGQPNRTPRVVVKIGIAEESIGVSDASQGLEWSVTVALNDEGRCVLKCEDGVLLEQWQFRKKALDHLFFVNRSGAFVTRDGVVL
jgi:hypothetical protein